METSGSFASVGFSLGGGGDARNALREGRGVGVGLLTISASRSSPGTKGRPDAAASTFHSAQGSPPATSISSFRIVEDHFSCRSSVCCFPSASKSLNVTLYKTYQDNSLNSSSISGLHASSAVFRTFSTWISRLGFAYCILGSCSFTKCL